jgi:hypothetical protein
MTGNHSMKNSTKARTIEAIEHDLNCAKGDEAANCIRIGALLIEAQETLDHGQWMPWLAKHWDRDPRTAQNYMGAARFAAKYESVSHLKLRPTALYGLGSLIGLEVEQEIVDAVFAEAEDRWVSGLRVSEIIDELAEAARQKEEQEDGGETEEEKNARRQRERQYRAQREIEEAKEAVARKREEAAEQREIDAIFSDPPPPKAEPVEEDKDVVSFISGINMLSPCVTKPLAKYGKSGTYIPPGKVRIIAEFLHSVADVIEGARP